MTISKLAPALLLAGLAWPAAAQTVSQDVRCLMLSNVFAQNATDERAKQAAAQSLLFYVGRLDGRADAQAITSAMRAQGTINNNLAPTEMAACATRMQRAQQTIQAAATAAAPKKK